ncbi:hypothetical protein CHH28_17980 [Bacterioplanes sanyensis]|uniref:Uncharacterized protein n=2 Tax=Bacterioplanes sanyensis TaxID=1249553 RepID=A0A222FN51_9GAMM|nr:hypothetical protein CHH28_17980 [Bacterioplanes sanyensis]
MTVPGQGPAHRDCYQQHLIEQRQFLGLNIRVLSDNQLAELQELVLMESNARQQANADIEVW